MSYIVYITRAEYHFDRESHPILESEWLAVASKDASLHHDMKQYYGRLKQSGEEEILHPRVWSEHPDGEEILFWFEEGAINSKNADEYTIDKMYSLAVLLKAKVLDEDDHVYDPSEVGQQSEVFDEELQGESELSDEPNQPSSRDTSGQVSRKSWWRSFFGK